MWSLLLLLIPFVAGCFLLSVSFKRGLNVFFIGSAVLQFMVALALFVEGAWFFEPVVVWHFNDWVRLSFHFEPLGGVFVLLVSFLWLLTSFYCVGYLQKDAVKSARLFYAYFLLSVFAVLWIGFSGDLLTMFVGYEFLTFLTYPLVVSKGTEKARRAGKLYLLLLLGSSLLFLVGILLVGFGFGSVAFVAGGIVAPGSQLFLLLGLFLWGIGKAALIPFHFWLPAAMVAPTPVSAFLHAVAVVKSGVFCLLKVGVYVFGFDALRADAGAVDVWLWVPVLTLLLAGFWAILQDDIKRRLAFSTVSQLSYIVLGWMLLNEAGILGSVMQMVGHAFAKITLFFVAGILYVHYGVSSLSGLRGMGYKMPVTFLCFAVAALSIAGVPFTVGFWGKLSLLLGAIESHGLLLVLVIVVGAVFSMLYLFQVVYVAFLPAEGQKPVFVRDAVSRMCLYPAMVSASGCVLLFFAGPWLLGFLEWSLTLMVGAK